MISQRTTVSTLTTHLCDQIVQQTESQIIRLNTPKLGRVKGQQYWTRFWLKLCIQIWSQCTDLKIS